MPKARKKVTIPQQEKQQETIWQRRAEGYIAHQQGVALDQCPYAGAEGEAWKAGHIAEAGAWQSLCHPA